MSPVDSFIDKLMGLSGYGDKAVELIEKNWKGIAIGLGIAIIVIFLAVTG